MGNIISMLYDRVSAMSGCLPVKCILYDGMAMTFFLGCQMFMNREFEQTPLKNFVFLSSLGISLGVQLWTSFVAGMTARRVLPRHHFGALQNQIFPKYFCLMSVCTFTSLSLFLGQRPMQTWKGETLKMGALLTGSYLMNMFNATCFNKNTIKYITKMHEMEKSAGVGLNTIGKLEEGTELEKQPEYIQVKSKFLHFHSMSLTANLLSLAATIGQFYLISSNKLFAF